MSRPESLAVLLAQRPVGEVRDEDFRLERRQVDELNDGEIRIRVQWISLDPYMRPRMNDMKSYMPPIPVGDVMVGESVGEVVESRSTKYQVGDTVCSASGWQSYFNVSENDPQLYKVDPEIISPSVYLGAAGMTARTAYFGLLKVGKPKAGETVVVSAAAGAVGSIVGQIAKMQGCRVVGVAGGTKKCTYVEDVLGFDACVDYKGGALEADLQAACPAGIDVYFENVGGAVTRAVAPLLNSGARVPICGYVSAYNATDITEVETPMQVFKALPEPPEHRFFLVNEWQTEYPEATRQLAQWIRDGSIQYRETVAAGLENAGQAFRGMLRGDNLGKQLVKLAE